VLEVLAKQNRLPPTLLLTTFEDDAALVCGVRAGARGYLLKGVLPETLIEAIRVLAAGGTYLYSPPVSATARTSVKGSWRDAAFDTPDSLTEREREVLRLMASGINNREIADALLLSEGTVKNHISSIFSKLGVTDRTKAVLHAIVKGLV
jgi:DNA-binding NarL/FixJ family response regulator